MYKKRLTSSDQPSSTSNPLSGLTFRDFPNGTITSANASKINDGACSLLIANEDGIKVNQIDPEFEILSFADAEMNPMDFNKTPSKAILKALERANLSLNDVNYFEINEVGNGI